ncbi:MAG: hypothetical protein NVS4B5_14030 [Vulcanimicrobiaceae bacterium]
MCANCRPAVDDFVRSPAQPLDLATREPLERRFGHDFSAVRIHADARAGDLARAQGALAYTIGNNIVLGAGHNLGSLEGKQLLAHELAHVVQQTGSASAGSVMIETAEADADVASRCVMAGLPSPPLRHVGGTVLQKAEKLGTKVTQPPGAKSAFKKISATFDGGTFMLLGDGKPVLTASGQSGRPNTVKAADAKACGGSPGDSYLNNPRYVGVKDNGPIPEGEYVFTRSSMTSFTALEQAKMSLASESAYVDPDGLALHGDWGAARAALRPIKLLPSKFCGSTASRSGFYLHGGIMPGSSGCIDIGNDAITKVVDLLVGFTDPIHVFVKYTVAAPAVGRVERGLGRFMYPGGKDPSFSDRVKSLFDLGD